MLVVGTGAVATLLAQRMSRANLAFQIFGSKSERLSVLNQRFLQRGVADPEKVTSHRLWCVCVKTWQNAEKVRLLQDAPKPEAILVLQNGFEPEAAWRDICLNVERGLSTYGVRADSPGHIRGGERGAIVLGNDSFFEEILRQAGFELRFTEDVRQAIWHKLAVNASLNVVASLYGLPNGGVLDHSAARRLVRLAAMEVQKVAHVAGVCWGRRSAWEMAKTVAKATAENVCSTLADLRSGRPTEYRDINVEVLGLASKLNVEVPVLEHLDQRFRLLTGGSERLTACGGVQ